MAAMRFSCLSICVRPSDDLLARFPGRLTLAPRAHTRHGGAQQDSRGTEKRMQSLPPEVIAFLDQLRPLFRAEVFVSVGYLLTGILVGEAKFGTIRSSVFAPAEYQPQRLSDLFTTHKLSHQEETGSRELAQCALAAKRIRGARFSAT